MNQEVFELISLIQNKIKVFEWHTVRFDEYKIGIRCDSCHIRRQLKGGGDSHMNLSISQRDLANKFEGEKLENFKFKLEEALLEII
jgi:hypothetical protein